VLSLILCLATVGLWVRSYWAAPAMQMRGWQIWCVRGTIKASNGPRVMAHVITHGEPDLAHPAISYVERSVHCGVVATATALLPAWWLVGAAADAASSAEAGAVRAVWLRPPRLAGPLPGMRAGCCVGRMIAWERSVADCSWASTCCP
jgi:hypothetical protein